MTVNIDTIYSSKIKGDWMMNFYEATESDLEGVGDLFNAYRMFYDQPTNRIAAHSFLENRMREKNPVIFVAKNQMDYIGFVQLYPTFSSISMKKAWILNDLYVVDTARRQGVAQRLIEMAIGLCEKTDAVYLALETASSNVQAKKLYEKNGFIHDDTFEHYQLSF